jgi:hypothetical protein
VPVFHATSVIGWGFGLIIFNMVRCSFYQTYDTAPLLSCEPAPYNCAISLYDSIAARQGVVRIVCVTNHEELKLLLSSHWAIYVYINSCVH